MNDNTLYPLTYDTPTPAYLPFPRFLVALEISNDARLLYALLFDRANLSRENGYLEPDGTVRLYFTVEEAKNKLRLSRQVATRAFQELEACGLIVRKKQGLGRPAKITLNIPVAEKKGGHTNDR
ncbi:replication initiator protein A [Lacrimispora sp. NSJ-141]|uniref:Replication initiator protein A n=1 Tax=Lientehia hominis TaxID=2897778 RepID=A0AAP2RKP1_9FIRM|nr:replication initiator protein A [Lientehia hominis]MCD2492705.1 replication initiator protein A [Lientehia hominis]